MNVWTLVFLITGIVAIAGAFIWLAIVMSGRPHGSSKKTANPIEALNDRADTDVEHIFNEEFREELRNRGRLHFEKIIGENAMFLQQDLRLTTSQLNEFMKTEITIKLQDEFAKYEESITDAKQMAIESITKTQEAIEQQRQVMGQQLVKEIEAEKKRLTDRFEHNMADIINHYVLAAIGDQIDLNDQLEYILADIEENKQAIIKDISDGA